MNKQTLKESVTDAKSVTRKALQTLYGVLNHGQQQKVLKEEEVKNLFDLYGVEYTE